MTPDSRQIIERLKVLQPVLQQEMGIGHLRIFGSVARGEAGPNSDVDILVDFEKLPGWKYFTMHEDIGALLNRKVDMATESSIDKYIRKRVLREAIDVF